MPDFMYRRQGHLPREEFSELPSIPPATPDLHSFLLKSPLTDDDYHPADLVFQIRDIFSDLPPYTKMLNKSHVADKIGQNAKRLEREMFIMAGAYPANDFYGSSHATKGPAFVNPHADNSALYSDAMVQCECGALILNRFDMDTHCEFPGADVNTHKEDCKLHWRLYAGAELVENRYNIIKEMKLLGKHNTEICQRIGLVRDTNIHNSIKRMNMDFGKLDNRFKELMLNTTKELLQVFNIREVARLYRVSDSHIQDILKEDGFDARQMYYDRRRNINETRKRASEHKPIIREAHLKD